MPFFGIDPELKARFKEAGLWHGRGSFTAHQTVLGQALLRPYRVKAVCLERFVPALESVESGERKALDLLDEFFTAGLPEFAADVASREEDLRAEPATTLRPSGAMLRDAKDAAEFAAVSGTRPKKRKKYKKRKKKRKAKTPVEKPARAQAGVPTAEVAQPDAGGDASSRAPTSRSDACPPGGPAPGVSGGDEPGSPPVGPSIDDIRWVYDHLDSKTAEIDQSTAPSRGAIAMHRFYSTAGRAAFYEKVVPRMLPKQAESDEGEAAIIEGKPVLDLIDEVQKQRRDAEAAARKRSG